MLVDHLRYGVAQQNDVLIKGFNIALQLNAVDQVNGYGNVLFAQGIQEGILKELGLIAIHTAPYSLFDVWESCFYSGIAGARRNNRTSP
jgi:hypothetical protein